MTNRARDWMAQAERDLAHAREARGAGRREWTCFAARQVAEKAVKALHLALGQEAWGHAIAQRMRELPSPPPAVLAEIACEIAETTGRGADVVDLARAPASVLRAALVHGKPLVCADRPLVGALVRRLVFDTEDFFPRVRRLLEARRRRWIGA